MNLDSDNFIAETLAKDVGAYGAGLGTTTAGVQRTRALLVARGILDDEDALVDGSGLSRGNHLSAKSLVRLIAAGRRRPDLGQAPDLIARPGRRGHPDPPLHSGVATKRVRAKTGYLDGVSAIAGRVISMRGRHYGFALMMNSPDITGARATQDNVVTLLAAGAEDVGPPPPPLAGTSALPSRIARNAASSRIGTPADSAFCELGAGVNAGDQERGGLAHRAGHLAPRRHDGALGVVPGERLQAAGDDHGVPRQRPLGRAAGASDTTVSPAARRRSSSSRLAPEDEELPDRLGHDGADALGLRSASASASSRLSSDGRTAATASAVTPPTWRMPRP